MTATSPPSPSSPSPSPASPAAAVDPEAIARRLTGEDGLDGFAGGDAQGDAHGDPFDALGPSDRAAAAAEVEDSVVARCALLDHSDTDNGERLRAHFGGDIVVVAQEGVAGGDWAGWTGAFWDLAGGPALAARTAQRLGGRIALEAGFLAFTPEEARAVKTAREFSGDDDSEPAKKARAAGVAAEKALEARKAARWRFAVTSKNSGRMKNMLECAAPHLRRAADGFNSDPLLVATLTHTLRFRRGAADPDTDGRGDLWEIEASAGHERAHWITALVPHAWRPGAACPLWTAFMLRLLPDPEVRRTVQAYCGASLLNVPLQRIMFHYGAGANGKSVFLEVLTRVFGDSFAIGLPPESITGDGQRGVGAASPDIARLFGKRMVRVLELPEGKPLHEDLVKRLTGGEKFPVRSLYKGYFEFVNRAKPHMSGNGFPTIDGTDHGIWRRMLVVHWGVTIPEGERREFEEVVGEMVAEGAGILQWLAEGALDFLKNGLPVAPAISAATEAYRKDMDPIGEFLGECVRARDGGTISARQLYEAYKSWSMANARRLRTEAKFGREAPKHLRRERRAGVQVYIDCELHGVPARPDEGGGGGYPEGYGG